MADHSDRRRVFAPARGPVSHANKVAAARVYIAASAKSGQPVPGWIRRIADSQDN